MPTEQIHSPWYVGAMEKLVTVVQELSLAHDLESVVAIVRKAARELTGADGATFVLRDGDQCYYVEENAIAPLWKGRRFPMSTCVSGWVMNHASPAVIEDIYSDPRVPTEAYKPTFVKSMAMVPIRRASPVGAIGNYWADRHVPTQEEVVVLQTLADTISVAMTNVDLYEQLRQQVEMLKEQQELIHGQHDSLAVFTRAMAHDLKEPVRAIEAFSKRIQDEPEERQNYFKHIEAASARMGMLLNTVSQYTQLDDPKVGAHGACSMQDVLAGVKQNLSLLIAERGADIQNGPLPQIPANPVHMAQVLQNLVANAIRHNKGQVTVRIEAEERPDEWLFAVRDNGCGIAARHLEFVFQPFKRLTHDDECSGLGLSICRKVIAIYGGKVWCESDSGKGAAFFFTVPKAEGQHANA